MQPTFYITGKSDGLSILYPQFDQLRIHVPGLVGSLEIEHAGHWVHHESSDLVSGQIVKFLNTIN